MSTTKPSINKVESSSSKRLPYIDNARAFAILSVILGHTLVTLIGVLNEGNQGAIESFLCTSILSYNMPLFMIISGYCAVHSFLRVKNGKGVMVFIKDKGMQLLLPKFVLGIIYALIIWKLWPANFITGGTNWFLTMIFWIMIACCIIFFLLQKIKTDMKFNFIMFIIFCCLLPIDKLYIGEMATYFIIGMLCSKYKVFDKLNNVFLVLALLVAGFTLLSIKNAIVDDHIYNFYLSSAKDTLFSSHWYIWFYRLSIGTFLSFGIIGLFRIFSRKNSLLTTWGTYTLAFYLLSDVFFTIFELTSVGESITTTTFYNQITATEPLRLISSVITVGLIIIIVWYAILLFNKYKLTRILILGKK